MRLDPKRKAHRVSKRGRKAEKKKASKVAKQTKLGGDKSDANINVSRKKLQQRNPKAFAFNSGIKAQKQAQRSQEVQQKRLACSTCGQSTPRSTSYDSGSCWTTWVWKEFPD